MNVQYFERAEMPGVQHFGCERMRATLSVGSCAGMWRQANGSEGGREACLRCPLGAQHAGEAQASLSAMHLAPICARCHRGARRLISAMVCVSCKNREYEFLRGKNAKGTTPVKLRDLCRRRIRFTVGGEPRNLVLQHSLDTDELIVATLRDSAQRVRFGFGASPSPAMRQLRLF